MSTIRLVDSMTLQEMHDAFDTFPEADAPYWVQDDRSTCSFTMLETRSAIEAFILQWKTNNPLPTP